MLCLAAVVLLLRSLLRHECSFFFSSLGNLDDFCNDLDGPSGHAYSLLLNPLLCLYLFYIFPSQHFLVPKRLASLNKALLRGVWIEDGVGWPPRGSIPDHDRWATVHGDP